MRLLMDLMDQGMLPDTVIRRGIKMLLRRRLRAENRGSIEANGESQRRLIASLNAAPVAVATDSANLQHYELPAEFFAEVLGPRFKYSCCLYPSGVSDMEAAEEAMLALTCQRASLEDGQDILELGCGWGSLTLWMAEHYPKASITAVSNSTPQRLFIDDLRRRRGLDNVRVITADVNAFAPEGRFDRVVSVEMFEHMRNYAELLKRISGWLRDDGLLFVHIFCHREYAYFFETTNEDDWMGRYFFTGGIMPSDHLLLYFNRHMAVEDHWRVNGVHYQKTCEDWLRRLDEKRERIMSILEKTYGQEARIWLQRWRVFFMACSELFGFKAGNEWLVSHYLFRKV